MALPLVDAFNDVVNFKTLGIDVATPSRKGAARQVQTYFHPADGITPGRLASYMRMAETGDPQWMLAYYEDMMERDPTLFGLMQQRMLSSAQWDMIVRPASDEPIDEEIAAFSQEILDQNGIRDARPTLEDATPKGYSVHWTQWRESRDMSGHRRWWPTSLEWRDPRWFLFGPDGKTIFLRGERNEPVKLPPYGYVRYIHHAKAGLPIRGGVAKVCAWYYMFKSYAIKDWLTFAETFWIPFLIGRLPNGVAVDSDEGRALGDMLVNLGHDLRLLLGEGQKIEILESGQKASSSQPIKDLLAYIDQSYGRAILGQLQTSDLTSSSHSQAKATVGKQMLESTLTSDDVRQRNGAILRDLIIPAIRLNYPPRPKYPTIESDNDVEVDSAQGPVVAQTIKDVASGQMPRDAGIGFLKVYAKLTEVQAETVLGSAGKGGATGGTPLGAEGGGAPKSIGQGSPLIPRGAQSRIRTSHLYDDNGNLVSSETTRS